MGYQRPTLNRSRSVQLVKRMKSCFQRSRLFWRAFTDSSPARYRVVDDTDVNICTSLTPLFFAMPAPNKLRKLKWVGFLFILVVRTASCPSVEGNAKVRQWCVIEVHQR